MLVGQRWRRKKDRASKDLVIVSLGYKGRVVLVDRERDATKVVWERPSDFEGTCFYTGLDVDDAYVGQALEWAKLNQVERAQLLPDDDLSMFD